MLREKFFGPKKNKDIKNEEALNPRRRAFLKMLAGAAAASVLPKQRVEAKENPEKPKTIEDLLIGERDRNLINLNEARMYAKKIKEYYGIQVKHEFGSLDIEVGNGEGIKANGTTPEQQAEFMRLLYKHLLRYPPLSYKPNNLVSYVSEITLGEGLAVKSFTFGMNKENKAGGLFTNRKVFLDISQGTKISKEKFAEVVSYKDLIVRIDFDHELAHSFDGTFTKDKWIKAINNELAKDYPKVLFLPIYANERTIVTDPKLPGWAKEDLVVDQFNPSMGERWSGYLKGYGIKSWREDFATTFGFFMNPYNLEKNSANPNDLRIVFAKVRVIRKIFEERFGLGEDYFELLDTERSGEGEVTDEDWEKFWAEKARKK